MKTIKLSRGERLQDKIDIATVIRIDGIDDDDIEENDSRMTIQETIELYNSLKYIALMKERKLS